MSISALMSIALFVSIASTIGSNTYACEPPTILAPQENQVISTSRPTIAWLPWDGQDWHEIEVIARVPEGEVVQRVQRSVHGSQWQPDVALATHDAVVSLRVTRQCRNGRAASYERKFHLTFAGACPTPAYMSPTKVDRFLQVYWKKTLPIKALEMKNFFGDAATPGESVTTDGSPALIRLSEKQKVIVGIRAHCDEGVSEWAWLPVASP